MSTSQVQLSSSRINRLLRPIRNKSTTLASSYSSLHPKPLVTVTYSSAARNGHTNNQGDRVSSLLANLPPPETLGFRMNLHRSSHENLQLSKKIYDTRDAFRNAISAAFGKCERESVSATPPNTRILSLSATCAVLVGEHIQTEVKASQCVQNDDYSHDDVENDDEMRIVCDIYEAIPPHCRKHTLAAHALSIILDTCPHSHTLLSCLLDVCLAYKLVRECQTLIRCLLAVAFKSSSPSSANLPTSLPHIAHPTHMNYLTQLRARCCDPATQSVMNDYNFTCLLVNVLDEQPLSSCRAGVWTCKALSRLSRQLRQRNFHAYLHLCSGLTRHVAGAATYSQQQARKQKKEDENQDTERERTLLAKWMRVILERLHDAYSSSVTKNCPVSEQFQSITNFLVLAHSLRLHVLMPTSTPLSDAMVCLATYCLTSSHFDSLTREDRFSLEAILRETRYNVNSGSFDLLVSTVYLVPVDTPSTPSATFSIDGGMHGASALHSFADALRKRSLVLSEAALWACALRQVEERCSSYRPESLTQHTVGSELEKLRLELVELLDEAERRCFEPRPDPSATPSSSKLIGKDEVGDCEWRWEEMVGSWILKTPQPRGPQRKKRKVASNTHTIGHMLGSQHTKENTAYLTEVFNVSSKTSRTVTARGSITRSSSVLSTSSSSTLVPSDRSRHSTKDLEDIKHAKPLPTPPSHSYSDHWSPSTPRQADENPKRSLCSRRLSSILADAQTNRIILHPQRQHKLPESDDDDLPDPICSAAQLSSDDALDLFAYAGSSPVASYRRRPLFER